MINIFVGMENEQVTVETDSELRSELGMEATTFVFVLNFHEWKSISLEEGLKNVEQYGTEYACEMSNWTESVDKFKELINGKVGNFYLWSVECDMNLMFVEDGEQLPDISEMT